MEVRIDRHQPVEARGYETRECRRGYGLAKLEASVLAHIGEVGRDQSDLVRAERAGGVGGECEPEEVIVRPCKRADEIHRSIGNI
jgi:hypothetical protein